ncbi:MAG: DNA helicase IV [Candidatus Malihini olakiniferum]
MELKATSIGKHLAQHPYNRVKLLNAGIRVSGEKHEYIISFHQLIDIQCKRGLVWGELEFVLPDNQAVRLHGTEWQETQQFYRYLIKMWRHWSDDISEVCATKLQRQIAEIETATIGRGWISHQALAQLQKKIHTTLASLPLPTTRLTEFVTCCDNYILCQQWLTEGDARRIEINEKWMKQMLSLEQVFFESIETTPLNISQCRAVINGEDSVLVLAGAGSGKTSVLIARAAWLLHRCEAVPEQILLLAFSQKAAQEMNERIRDRLHTEAIQAKTFHALALHIIQQATRKALLISRLESDNAQKRELLIEAWRQQCAGKKVQAKGWREWLSNELEWDVPEGAFWLDTCLAARLAGRLERWLRLMPKQGESQREKLSQVDEEQRPRLQRGLRLMAPLLKAWEAALKEEGAVDFSGLIRHAVNLLDKGLFISPWKHILVDEFQDISPQHAQLLAALCRQSQRTSLFAVGDDWQAIDYFRDAELTLSTVFEHYFGRVERCVLDTTYRFNDRISEIANTFVQQNPYQLKKPLNSLRNGDKKAVTLLPEVQLEALFNKLSSFVTPDEHILILARHHHLRPVMLDQASMQWPNLLINFMTIHASKGQQADYVVILGLNDGQEGFPALARESFLEQVFLPQPEPYTDAEERRLLYVALTRAKHRVWLLYDCNVPSVFVKQLHRIGVPLQRKP